MKKRIVTLMLSLALLLGMIPINSIADRTVYITRTGSKYHSTKDCSGLNRAKSIYSCSESEAQSRGLTKCSICWDSSSSDDTSSYDDPPVVDEPSSTDEPPIVDEPSSNDEIVDNTPANNTPVIDVDKSATKTTKVVTVKTVRKNRYVITSKSTVRYKSPVSKKITSIKIPKSVKIKGKTYKVTAIGKKAFAGCSKLKKVTIKAPIKKIGKYAFYNCKKLKTIRIYSKKLTKSNVLTGAFKGISKKATFYLPKSKKAAYKKIFLKRGAKKTMKFVTN